MEIKVKQNPKNPKRPIIYWGANKNAESYILYLNGELIYSGRENIFYSKTDLNYGQYAAVVTAMTSNKKAINGEKYTVYIGLEPPKLLEPKNKAIFQTLRPTFKWSESEGTEKYELYLNGKKIYEGLSTSYSLPIDIEPGENTWGVLAINKFQSVKSESNRFGIIPIKAASLLSPIDKYEIYLTSTDELPVFMWQGREGSDSIYELYIDHQLVYRGKDMEFLVEDKNKIKTSLTKGSHSWYVLTEKDYQRISTPIRYYTCIEGLGLEMGLIAGPNLNRKSIGPDPNYGMSTFGKLGVNVGFYFDYIIPAFETFQLHVVAELNYDFRRNAIPHEDWYHTYEKRDDYGNIIYQQDEKTQSYYPVNDEYPTKNQQFLIYREHWFCIPIMFRPIFKSGGFSYYGLTGVNIDILLSGNIERNPDNFYKYEDFKPKSNVGVSIPVALGLNYEFDSILWLNTKMCFGTEIRYYHSITSEMRSFSNKDKFNRNSYNLELMFLVTTRLLSL